MNELLIRALKAKNDQRPPVWLMRQAGRYMPEYRVLRERHTLWELFHNSELAAEITHLPLKLLDVDAAILFSDILVIAEVFGLNIQFPDKGGPLIEPTLKTKEDVSALQMKDVDDVLHYVKDTILLLKKDLKVPLLGFCGAPFTVASYMIENGGKNGLPKTKEWLYRDPVSFHQLLQKTTDASIRYLRMQIKAGVNAVQIFDSWASVLGITQLHEFSFSYLKQMVDAVAPTPAIIFCRGSSLYPKELSSLNASCISFDWQKDLAELRKDVPQTMAVQGNLDPDLLKAPKSLIESSVKRLLTSMRRDPGFIVNLGHGVLPDTPVDHVRCFVDTVKQFAL